MIPSRSRDFSDRERADYIASATAELMQLVAPRDKVLRYLLEMAHLEAMDIAIGEAERARNRTWRDAG